MERTKVAYETRLTQFLLGKAGQSRVPMNGTFELTPMCNFSCKMCYVRQTQQQISEHDRPMVKLERWLEMAQELKDEGMLYLLLTGGEPLMWPDFWTLYEKLARMGFIISINSNGSFVDEYAAQRFAQLPPARINITLYGASDETYSRLCGVPDGFTRVDRGIKVLRRAGVMVKLNCSLTPYNYGDMAEMIRYAEDNRLILEANSYMFPPLRRDRDSVGRNDRFTPEQAAEVHIQRCRMQYGQEQFGKFIKDIASGKGSPPGLDEACIDAKDGRINCRAGKSSFWITWDGMMMPCGMMPEPAQDVLQQNPVQAWRKIVEESAQIRLSGICGSCDSRGICHSCAATAMAETGSLTGVPRYLCRMAERMREIARSTVEDID